MIRFLRSLRSYPKDISFKLNCRLEFRLSDIEEDDGKMPDDIREEMISYIDNKLRGIYVNYSWDLKDISTGKEDNNLIVEVFPKFMDLF